MNWLMSNNQNGSDTPETPAHRWVFNALKGVVLPETPFPKATANPSGANNKLQNSILKGSRFTKERRTNNVTFHKSVRTPPKRSFRSGLPREFPGRFPSPYTPRTVESEDTGVESDGKECQESPLGIEKDRRETMRSSRLNPLKKLSLRLNDHKGDGSYGADDKMNSSKISNLPDYRPLRHKVQPLKWDVDKGFAEVLESIHKNNDYLQSLIDEMQESCCQLDESFVEDRSSSGSDVTVNLDEPRSRSGQYWKAKFSEFSALTEKVRAEQNNMQRALLQLKTSVNDRNDHLTETWKDKHDILLEELAKVKKSNRESAPLREVRELRRQVRDAQTVARERDSLREQLSIADAQVQDLQCRLETARSTKSDIEQNAEETALSKRPHEPTTKYNVGSRGLLPSHCMPQSATARRLAKAQADQLAKNNDPSVSETAEAPVESRWATIAPQTSKGSHQAESRTYTNRKDKAAEQAPEFRSTLTFKTSQSRTVTSSSPLSSTTVRDCAPKESPRPAFASLDVNAKSVSADHIDEATKERLARREAARKRLELKRLERAKQKTQTVLVR